MNFYALSMTEDELYQALAAVHNHYLMLDRGVADMRRYFGERDSFGQIESAQRLVDATYSALLKLQALDTERIRHSRDRTLIDWAAM